MERWENEQNISEMMIYTTEDGLTKIETTFDGDTVWLSIDQMAELFQRDKSKLLEARQARFIAKTRPTNIILSIG